MKKDEVMDPLLRRAARASGDVRPDACLDADTLAAWLDGSLPNNERVLAEAHAADCDRCLAVLAAIAKTTPAGSETPQPSWLSLRWLLPLGAAAAAIVAVVLVQDPRGPAPQPPSAPSVVDALSAPAPAAAPEREPAAQVGAAAAAKEAPTQKEKSSAAPSARRSAPADASATANPQLADEAVEKRAAGNPLPEIVSPDASVRWRLAGPSLERSTNAGRTWVGQATGTEAPLLAGAAPSSNVCWIVGRRGTVLLTTDAGGTWRRVEFPDLQADLVSVTARDARSATVTSADGRTYRTEDGGLTWLLQENSGTTF